jgi:hypothetical protein
MFRTLWRRRAQDADDARVAFDVAVSKHWRRATWAAAYAQAMGRVPKPLRRRDDADDRAGERARVTYRRVARRLDENPGRYWWADEGFWSGDGEPPEAE